MEFQHVIDSLPVLKTFDEDTRSDCYVAILEILRSKHFNSRNQLFRYINLRIFGIRNDNFRKNNSINQLLDNRVYNDYHYDLFFDLSEEEKQLIQLRLSGYTYQEIADMYNVSHSTIIKRLRKIGKMVY